MRRFTVPMHLVTLGFLALLVAAPASAVDLLGPDDFEVGLGNYSNVAGDNFDWTRDSAGTPSTGTGPSVDHTLGTSLGSYLFTEASNPNNPNMTASLESSCITGFSGYSDAAVSFFYHMLGTVQMGTLFVDVTTNCTTPSWTNEFSVTGNQGDVWNPANVDLTAYIGGEVKLRFRGVTGSGWSSDIAIDDVTVTATPVTACTLDSQCNDSNVCTDDVCVGGFCQNNPNTASCDDGVACTGGDVCSAGVCAGVDSCTGGTSCNPGSGVCEASAAQFLVDSLNLQRFKDNIQTLSSLGPPTNGTRYWRTAGNAAARDWIQAELESYGYTVERDA